MTPLKLEYRFNLIFFAICIPVLMVTDPEKVYDDGELSKSYSNHILMLSVGYHIATLMIAGVNTNWNTIYLLLFSMIFGVLQACVADNYLCTIGILQYPLNKNPMFDFLGDCIPFYMLFCWSMFGYLEIKLCLLIYNQKSKILSIIISTLLGYLLVICMEISTDLAISDTRFIALWRANTKHPKVDLIYGGLPSYLILPELVLCSILSVVYFLMLQPLTINKKTSTIKYLFCSLMAASLVMMTYVNALMFCVENHPFIG